MGRQSVFKSNIGFGRRDITPPVGIYSRCWGAAEFDCATGMHKPLYATAMVVASENDPDNYYALINFDGTIFANKDDEWETRNAVMEALKVDASQVMIGVSHTHSVMFLSRENKDKPGGDLVVPYLTKIREQIVEAVLEAKDNLQPAHLNWYQGVCDLAANRDLKVADETQYITGFNPEVEADQTVLVGKVTNLSEQTLGVLVNYACHPTTLGWENQLISPDYIGSLRETVETHYPGALCLFLLGACGELAPSLQYCSETWVADKHGMKLGFSVLSTMQGLSNSEELHLAGVQESGAPLAVWKQTAVKKVSNLLQARIVEVPIRIKQEWQDVEKLKKESDKAEDRVARERHLRKIRVRESLGDTTDFRLPVWIWKFGDTIFVGTQAEPYSILQTELRQAFPNHTVIVMNLINGAIGYLPEAHLYSEDIYTVWQTPFDKGGLEVLIETSKNAIRMILDNAISKKY